MVFENEVENLKRKYLQIHKSPFPFGLKVRQMKYDLKGLYAIETSNVPKLLHVATDGVSFGFYQGLAESVVSSAKSIKTIEDVADDAIKNSNKSFDDLANMAKEWQGSGDYPGIDDWKNIELRKGTKVWGGTPGQSSFYTTDDIIKLTGNDASKIFKGLQVGKGPFPSYRPGMTQYRVMKNIRAGYSKALANPQYGIGGFDQYFIPNYEDVLQPVKSIILKNR